MRLENIDEIRAQGVTVYPHVVEPKAQMLSCAKCQREITDPEDDDYHMWRGGICYCAECCPGCDDCKRDLAILLPRIEKLIDKDPDLGTPDAMILASLVERAMGIERRLHQHVVEKAQPLDVSRWRLSPWAKWVAADASGDIFEFSVKPEPQEQRRIWVYNDPNCDEQYQHIGTIRMAGIDWRKTLTAVNVEQRAASAERLAAARAAMADDDDAEDFDDDPALWDKLTPYTPHGAI